MTVYGLTLLHDSIDPRWFRQHVDRDFDECVVDIDGTEAKALSDADTVFKYDSLDAHVIGV